MLTGNSLSEQRSGFFKFVECGLLACYTDCEIVECELFRNGFKSCFHFVEVLVKAVAKLLDEEII